MAFSIQPLPCQICLYGDCYYYGSHLPIHEFIFLLIWIMYELEFAMHRLMGFPGGARRRQWHPTPVFVPGKSHGRRSLVGRSPSGREESDMTERLHFHFHAMEKEMATHSSVLAWRIPGMEEPDGLLSMGSHTVGHD